MAVEATELRIEWESGPAVSLFVRRARALTADEIRVFADIVEAIETLREAVRDNEQVGL